MKEGPDITRIAQLIGDPARANMLCALMSGKALTATELANEAGVTLQTTSGHLAKMVDGGLVANRKQGRHKYYQLLDDDVAHLLENLMSVAAQKGHLRAQTGPKDPELRHARVCYDHLAGDLGTKLYSALIKTGHLKEIGDQTEITETGVSFFEENGFELEALHNSRRQLCRQCLDWSERRTHLAGTLGASILQHIYEKKWAKRDDNSRVVRFSKQGEAAFKAVFAVEL